MGEPFFKENTRLLCVKYGVKTVINQTLTASVIWRMVQGRKTILFFLSHHPLISLQIAWRHQSPHQVLDRQQKTAEYGVGRN